MSTSPTPSPPRTAREEQARESYLRWQKLSTTQLGSVVKLVLTLNVGALAFGANLLVQRKADSGLGWYIAAIAILLGSAFLGLLINFARMMSFRWTTRSARMGQLYEENWAVEAYRPLPWFENELDADRLLDYEQNADENSLPVKLSKKLEELHPSTTASRVTEKKSESLDQKTWRTIRNYCREECDRWDRRTLRWVPWQFVLFLFGIALLAWGVWRHPIERSSEEPQKVMGMSAPSARACDSRSHPVYNFDPVTSRTS